MWAWDGAVFSWAMQQQADGQAGRQQAPPPSPRRAPPLLSSLLPCPSAGDRQWRSGCLILSLSLSALACSSNSVPHYKSSGVVVCGDSTFVTPPSFLLPPRAQQSSASKPPPARSDSASFFPPCCRYHTLCIVQYYTELLYVPCSVQYTHTHISVPTCLSCPAEVACLLVTLGGGEGTTLAARGAGRARPEMRGNNWRRRGWRRLDGRQHKEDATEDQKRGSEASKRPTKLAWQKEKSHTVDVCALCARYMSTLCAEPQAREHAGRCCAVVCRPDRAQACSRLEQENRRGSGPVSLFSPSLSFSWRHPSNGVTKEVSIGERWKPNQV